ncbi:hypothetical protein BHM03_00014755 [Ensete ventricosum]|uniref:Uncharacterized protein n=1 Tax=Ensete ventricosum TaxID=4639 RepID=A0A445MEB0_ENSVE|nr:hypothetical protein BHM03_00014755 [Ensete ventricosum]
MGPSASWELLAKNAPGHPAAFVDPRVSASLTSALRGQPREAQIDAGEVGLSSALSRIDWGREMNGGEEGGGGGGEEMEEDGKEEMMVVEARGRDKTVLMWGYLPGVSPQRSPLLHPVAIRMPDSPAGDRWKDVSGGGCGFAIAISGIGRYFYYFPSACAFCPFRFGFGLLLSERQRP